MTLDETSLKLTRQDKAPLLDALREAGANVDNPSRIRCPFHDDQHPSAGVYRDEDGVWRFKCHGCEFGGDVYDVRARAHARPIGELLPKREEPPSKAERTWPSLDALVASVSRVEAVHRYTNPDTGRIDYAAVRWMAPDGKAFLPCHETPRGWVKSAPPKPWPLYNRARVRDAQAVIVVEGEKCVEALHRVGYVATTSPAGAGKAEYADWSPLAGKVAYLWPDNDPPNAKGERTGIAHMRKVAEILQRLDPPCDVRWIDPDGLDLPPKGDAADLVASCECDAQAAREIIETILDTAESLGMDAGLKALIQDTIAGRRRAIEWPWPSLTRLSKALMPGTLTVFCGEGGSAKSLMILQAAAHWHDAKVRTAVLELEDGHAYHMLRALAQRAGVSGLTDDDWVRANPERSLSLHEEHRGFIASFGRCIHEVPDDQWAMKEIGDWVEARAAEGCRIIVVDPITAANQADKQFIEDARFVYRVKRIAEQHECSIVLVTHPTKTRGTKSGMSEVAGGTAYTRFAQTVLWLERMDDRKGVSVMRQMAGHKFTEVANPDRHLHLRKTRNGVGAGLSIAFTLTPGELRFEELGVIVKDG